MPDVNSKVALLSVKRLSLSYGHMFSLQGIQFDLFPSEITGLIGPNGCGKTTLMEGLVGLLPVAEKTICNSNGAILERQLKDFFFYIPDGVRPYPLLSVNQVLSFYRNSFYRSKDDLEKIIADLELQRVLDKTIKHLSKGFARRMLLAIGLLSTQPVLVLDEPLDGFDVKQLQRIVPLLRREANLGRALFVCIHQLSDAERICDRFLLLKEGRLVAQGTKEALKLMTKSQTGSLEDVFLELA